MHARIDQLLSLCDGDPVEAGIRLHVDDCADCSRALADLELTRRRLNALPTLPAADAEAWQKLRARLSPTETGRAPTRWRWGIATAATAAVLAVLVALRLQGGAGTTLVSVADVAAPTRDSAQHAIAELRQRSRELEEVLAALPARPAVERAATALPIDALQSQVLWVDHRLSESSVDDATPADTEKLWRERVEIMSSLVQLRYVEAQRVAL
jgi:hypothetical protein